MDQFTHSLMNVPEVTRECIFTWDKNGEFSRRVIDALFGVATMDWIQSIVATRNSASITRQFIKLSTSVMAVIGSKGDERKRGLKGITCTWLIRGQTEATNRVVSFNQWYMYFYMYIHHIVKEMMKENVG